MANNNDGTKKVEMITRSFFKTMIHPAQLDANMQVVPGQPFEVDGKLDKVKATAAAVKAFSDDSVFVAKLEYTSTTYGMPLADFMAIAKPVGGTADISEGGK